MEELENEVVKLREQLGKARGINDTMWETVVQKMVNESKSKAKNSKGTDEQGGFVALDVEDENEESGERRRKRSRA